ncbi:MAG: glycerol-3-phosphate 1-O-acyltransferase PlsY [Verrucomicrobiota bacterium]
MPPPGPLALLSILLLAYVAGATPFGYLVAKWKGIDIREHGSGNIGATNVIRVLGKKIGIPVFAMDMLKGLLPVVAARLWCTQTGHEPTWPMLLTALGSVLGHNFTFWLGFKGGKGVATSAGAILALLPAALGVAVVVWMIFFFSTRYVAVASIAAGLSLPLTVLAQRALTGGPALPLLGFATVIGLLAVWRHRSNIQRLREGTENRFIPRSERPTA